MIKLRNLIGAVSVALLLAACGGQSQKQTDGLSGTLTIFHAGSLSLPMKAAADSFMRMHPNVTINLEAAGSVECARKITELNRPCDVMASADYKVIDKLLIPDFASWNIAFAGNEMALVYHDASRYAAEINDTNWYTLLQKEDVAYGRSDPNADPCGYRTVMALQLAEKFYAQPNLAKSVLDKDNRYIRPKEVDLLALLESSTIDYIFLYKSVAVQHGLRYLELPSEVNLANPALDSLYATVSVEVKGKTPGSTMVMTGEPMVYGLTIPKSTPNPEAAQAFVEYFLSEGQSIMAQMGQKPLVPAPTVSFDSIPEPLKRFATLK